MDPNFKPPSGRELKYALNRALIVAARWILIEESGSDLPEDLMELAYFNFEVQELSSNEFVIRAKQIGDHGEPLNRPAIHFDVKISGGG